MRVTKEIFRRWREDPVTQMFMADVQSLREKLKEDLANGMYPGADNYHNVLGRTQILAEILAGTFLELVSEEEENLNA